MKYLKGTRAIGTLFAISSILLAVACFTITNSFSMPDSYKVIKKWNVALIDASTSNDDGKVLVSNDKMDINVILNESGELFTVNAVISNTGSFNAILNNVDVTNLNNIKIGTSDETGITYYLSDYVDVYMKYSEDNKNNEILAGSNLGFGDKLNKYTQNKIVIGIQYKNTATLSQDALIVLNQNVKLVDGHRTLKFTMSVSVNYVENKN